MYRLFIKQLEDWKGSTNRKPLIVIGARQVGKTFIIKQFGEKNFKGKVHALDFEKHPDLHSVFDNNLDPQRIVSELEVIFNDSIELGKDLLFMDEIQALPKALMSLRYFYENMPDLHVIAAGSLLDFAIKDISFPVGRVNIKSMHPMNFYEFLLAIGSDKLAEKIVSKPEKLPDSIHKVLLDKLRQFLYIGGMPECVDVWSKTQSYNEVFQVQSDLLESYRQDFSKYTPYTDKQNLRSILSVIAKNIGHQLKYTRLSDEFSGPTNKKAFELLQLARVIHKIKSSSPGSLPFEASASERRFKAILVDIGLMRALNEIPASIEFKKKNILSMYNGAMAEQFVGQEFLSLGMSNLYCWIRNVKSSSAEVDYLINKKNSIVPIEIKGGSAGKLRSLHLLLKEYPSIKQACVFSEAPFGKIPEQKITFLPLYYAYGLVSNLFEI
ncbi:MAG: AAA family ATPase [Bacteroidales bacterium]|nr:AAA family ATPase [Bacteroidales bacterium]MCF8397876.1 AAA family ATPase [Bacteroidales bacterium]